MKELVEFEEDWITGKKHDGAGEKEEHAIYDLLLRAKQFGYSDVQLQIASKFEAPLRVVRDALGIKPVYKLVDTCAAEFEAATPYYYSTYEEPYTINGKPVTEDEIRLTNRPKVIIIGGGPNRIGQ